MANEELKSHLRQLQQQLEDSRIGADDKNLLGNLMSDIVRLSRGDESVQGDVHASFREKLEQQATDFEQHHPTLASLLRQTADILGKMGI